MAKSEEFHTCQAESPEEPPAEAQCWALADGYPHIKAPSMSMRRFANFNLLKLAYICVGAIISWADPRSITSTCTICVPISFLGTGASGFSLEESKFWHVGVLDCLDAQHVVVKPFSGMLHV